MFAQMLRSLKCLKEFGKAGKETSIVKRLSEASVFLGEIHHLFLLLVHQLTGDYNFFFCIICPLLGRGFSLQYKGFFSLWQRFSNVHICSCILGLLACISRLTVVLF